MKKLKYALTLALMATLGLGSCADMTEVEKKDFDIIGGYNTLNNEKSEEYYANLRAWKATAKNYERPVFFGWFSNWAPVGVNRKGYLSSLPDSVDMVSMWDGPFNLTPEKKADKENFQKKKGSRIYVCYILHDIGTGITPDSVAKKVEAANPNASQGELTKLKQKAQHEYWGFTSGKLGAPDHLAAIQRYADVLFDSICVNDYDGLDVDWEPSGGGVGTGALVGNGGQYLEEFFKAIGKYMGPKSDLKNVPDGKYRYLMIDGEIWNASPGCGQYLDYFISQDYNTPNIGGRVEMFKKMFGDSYDPKKHISTDNFESYWQTGGYLFQHAEYVHPTLGHIGGCGAFRLDNDYDNTPDYKYCRQAIQMLHSSYAKYLQEKNASNP